MSLRGRNFLITSGPTRAPLDAVRFLSNKSSGRLGGLIAEEAIARGAAVTYVYGRGSHVPTIRRGIHDSLRLVAIETVQDLEQVFRQELPRGYDAVIHPMAVLDFEPADVRQEKTASDAAWVVRLVPTPKVIHLVKELSPTTFLVGFKLEVGRARDDLLDLARVLLHKSHADLVVANDLRDIEGGRHVGYFVEPSGQVAQTVTGKEAIARAVIEYVEARIGVVRVGE